MERREKSIPPKGKSAEEIVICELDINELAKSASVEVQDVEKVEEVVADDVLEGGKELPIPDPLANFGPPIRASRQRRNGIPPRI